MKQKRIYRQDISRLRTQVSNMLTNKYFNLWMDSFEFEGISPEQSDYLMKQFWAVGSIAAFKIKHLDEVGFAPYAVQRYNMYDFPEEVILINKRNIPLIPSGVKVVQKDVILGWIQPNHKPIMDIVNHYIERITSVEMVINTNLQLSKMPFGVGISPEDKEKAMDIVDRILNDEVVVFMDFQSLNMVQSLTTNTPYIIDKLYSYKVSLENELLTYLGLDNSGTTSNSHEQRMLVDEVNSNNAVINANQESFQKNIENFLDAIEEILGIKITVQPAHKPVASVHEEPEREREAEEDV